MRARASTARWSLAIAFACRAGVDGRPEPFQQAKQTQLNVLFSRLDATTKLLAQMRC
jgi:hypothetical protein